MKFANTDDPTVLARYAHTEYVWSDIMHKLIKGYSLC